MNWGRKTDPSSMLFSAGMLSRLVFPLSYNFMMLCNLEETSPLEKVMGPMKKVKFFGGAFNTVFFPICLFLIFVFIAFDIYGKMMSCFGLSRF